MKLNGINILIGLFVITMVPLLIFTSKIELSQAGKKQISKEEQNQLFDMYSQGNVPGAARNIIHGGPIYYQGWVKYFKYENGDISRPENFFQNNEYFSQHVLKSEKKSKDKYGSLSIPSKFHFYASLTKDTLTLLSSRKNKLQKTVDALQVDLIKTIPKDDPTKGGIQSLGEFDEGNCVQVYTIVPDSAILDFDNTENDGNDVNWIFCFDTLELRALFISQLTKIKVVKQKVRGTNDFSTKKEKPSLSSLIKPKTPQIEKYNGPDKNPEKDGFWILLQDWSQCSLKCGGGVQYQQWSCQPPLEGGKPCQGQAIRSKPCNINPCPTVTTAKSFGKPQEEVLKPIIKSLPWSSRYQRYIECEVKETDVMFIKKDIPGKIGKEIKFPGRLVMTNRTLVLYEDDSFEKSVNTFNLQETAITKYKSDPCCLVFSSLDKKFRVCGFESDCGTKENPKFVPDWIRAFDLFSRRCYVDLPKKNWKKEIKKAEEEDKGGIQADLAPLHNRENVIKRKIEEKQQKEIEVKISSTQELALKAIRKELKLEKLIKNEEKVKEQAMLKDLYQQKIKEEKKQECLQAALKDKEDQNKKKRNVDVADLELVRIKQEAKLDVQKERLNLRKKIQEMKKVTMRKRKALEQKISIIRNQIADSLVLANKNGDMKLCVDSSKDETKIRNYCDSNFVEDYEKNSECKDVERFCPLCCENEFGGLFLNNRDDCYKSCDEIVKEQIKGDWVWTKSLE